MLVSKKSISFFAQKIIINTLATRDRDIPAQDEDGKRMLGIVGRNYADHFLQPFLQALEKIDVKPKGIKNLESYNSRKFSETIKIATAIVLLTLGNY